MGIKKIQGVKTTKQLIRAGTQHKAQTVISPRHLFVFNAEVLICKQQ
jgi:hypothetical protein